MGCLEANMFMLYESMKAFILLVYICAITFQCVFYNSSPQYDNSFTHRYFNPLFQFHLLFLSYTEKYGLYSLGHKRRCLSEC